ncbi:class I SAM-dependent methyltransferase [Streptomyces avidinii]|uniref:Cyclopropane-fatty-acyl-phospholipid synthase n=1 Tax=Streptomyces avidinii TaxID=1895 RepID=A0ABS4KWC8_STRAV|nr:class I SAM-dependent methyltransferase [Streptomyces avidinii]MBP2034338.1 cyclopropane-fatty-acyl-phospholipid synthase [Streptomyces avidinii]WST42845.1 class I SAM-dependent methyltransferase [Streptomyces avidinii]WST49962.1 class I SAM-dependent methyltransferase [Streptomyces avidinii]WTA95022.1 class I SAM-dependent methyltransferase [Streptomyces avidinii]WTB02118.1 class I SAM-dependent methyltransferase [Streptomyces avidinii]
MTTVAPKSVDPEVDAIRHHYEVSNDFYRLLLGPTMMYSGGYWEDGEDLVATLDEAQERKLDKFAELAGVAAGRTGRVLDIGCGWGTMLNRLTTVHGAEQAVGLTLSRTQEAFIAGLDNPRITTLVQSWADYKVADDSEKYDAAFCINALEHFVSSNLPPKERTKRYRYFFQQVANALNPGAKFVLHTMTAEALPMNRALLDDLKFLQRSEFEGCHIPHLSELSAAAEGLFEIDEIVNERESFAMACRAWLVLLAERRDEAVAMEGEEVVSRFERYLDIFAYTLEDKFFNNFRVTITRR